MSLTIVTWNVEWATPGSGKTAHLLNRIHRHAPEVVCLTETHRELLSPRGYAVCSRPDSGNPIKCGRKVMLWSEQPWRQVDDLGIDSLPPGRFVSGVTQTSLGDVTVVGVCIPWFGSRTRRGSARRGRWEDHAQYLDGLRPVLEQLPRERVIVMGDFNQRLGPFSLAPAELRRALHAALPPGMRIITSDLAFEGRDTIDHVALTADMAAESVSVISHLNEGEALSDHFGVIADVSARRAR